MMDLMSKKPILRITLMIILGAFLLWFLILLIVPRPGAQTLPGSSILPAVQIFSDPKREEKAASQGEFLKQPWGRDPFSEGAGDVEVAETDFQSDENFSLTGVIMRKDKKVAILNRMFVREGDEVSGVKIVRIERDRILLNRQGEEITVRMGATS